jgi:cytochrome c oxidase subunit 4
MTEHGASHGADEHAHPDLKRWYLGIFGMLTLGTILTMVAAGINLGGPLANILVAVLIAAVKASFVMAIFMHLKFDEKVLRIAVFFPLALLGVFVLGNVPDTSVEMRHPSHAPQKLERPFELKAKKAAGGAEESGAGQKPEGGAKPQPSDDD